MTYSLRVSSSVEKEMEEAKMWYEHSRLGLGLDFITAIESVFAHILTQPLAYPLIYANYRRALLWRFPFAIFFRIEGDIIKIAALSHTKRAPTKWQNYLSKH